MRTHLTLVSLLLCATIPAAAQTGVAGIQPLAFGILLPGIATTIAPTNSASCGEFTLTGNKNELVLVRFSLPTYMSGPGGARLPLTFGGNSAGYSSSSSTSGETTFDPSQIQFVQLANNGTGALYLGATASPGTAQNAGSYSATVTLTATFIP
jgi:hypothetical protein